MITKQEILQLLADTECHSVERTTSKNDMDKFCQAICAFSNKMRTLILFILTSFLIGCTSSQTEKTIEVAFTEDISDYTPLVKDILESNPKGNIKIKFGDGTYKFYPEKAYEKYITIYTYHQVVL